MRRTTALSASDGCYAIIEHLAISSVEDTEITGFPTARTHYPFTTPLIIYMLLPCTLVLLSMLCELYYSGLYLCLNIAWSLNSPACLFFDDECFLCCCSNRISVTPSSEYLTHFVTIMFISSLRLYYH